MSESLCVPTRFMGTLSLPAPSGEGRGGAGRTGPPAVAEPARAGQPEMSKLDRREALRAAQVAVVSERAAFSILQRRERGSDC